MPMRTRLFFCVALLLPAPLYAAEGAPPSARDGFEDCRVSLPDGLQEYRARCRHFRVPVDHADPAAGQLSLFMAKVPARRADPEPDPLVLLAGGPGQAATEVWPSLREALERINRDRDIWLLDQRGTGGSSPLDCDFGPATSLFEATEAEMSQAIAGCRAQLQAEGRALQHFTTSDMIADLEFVRQALGAPRLNLYGGSYGTRVGLEYLRRHPHAVRSAMLDGVVPPELALGQDHARNLDRALTLAFAACAADSACGGRFGDPARTLSRLRERLRRSAPTLRIHAPRSHEPLERPLTHDVLAVVLRLYAYAPESIALLPLLIDEADQDRLEPLLAQSLMLAEAMNATIQVGLAMSVSCSEDAFRLRNDPADQARLLGQSLTAMLIRECRQWPTKAPPPGFTEALESDVPVLLLSGQWDPVTPPRYAEQVARTLSRVRHLVAPGQGHIVIGRGCMPKLAAAFVDTADPDVVDPQCLTALRPAPFYLNYNGPRP